MMLRPSLEAESGTPDKLQTVLFFLFIDDCLAKHSHENGKLKAGGAESAHT